MDAGPSRKQEDVGSDPHGWNTFENYQIVHQNRLNTHPFVEYDTLEFSLVRHSNGEYVSCIGVVYCRQGVVVEVEKYLETSRVSGVLWVRAERYLYVARRPGKHMILRYHNIHARDDYFHHRVFDPNTGEEVLYERLTRRQFPTLGAVLDEVAEVMEQAAT